MENQNINQEQTQEQPKQAQGWRDVVLTPDMPVNALVHFLNIINQRLCTIEDATVVDGKTLTEIYAEEAAQEAQ